MEWLTRLYGKTIGLDTAPLIYFVEKHPLYHPRIRPFFLALERGEFKVVTSTLTITEVLVHPMRHDNAELTVAYSDILRTASHLQTLSVTASIAETAARLRASHNIRTPDAIQMATAIEMKADFFLTNDVKLAIVPNPTVLILENLGE